MGSLEKYRDVIRRILMEYVNIPLGRTDLRHYPVFDQENDRYLVIVSGWEGPRRVHSIVIQLDIIDGKIWLQCDNTDTVVADELERAGVSKNEIVLGFKPPSVRPLTDYAVA